MRKYLLFYAIFFSYSLNAQTFNVANHNKSETVPPCLAVLFNEYHFATTITDAYNFGRTYFYKASNGVIRYRKQSPFDFVPTRVIKTMDDKIMYIGTQPFCDALVLPYKNYIIKMDTAGVISFTNSFNENQMDQAMNIVQYTDSTYYVFTDSILYHYSKSGTFLMRKNTGLTQISSAIMDPSGGGDIYLSAKKNSNIAICAMNSLGVVTNTVSSSILFTKLEAYGGGQLMGIGTDGRIYKHTYNFISMGSSSFPPTINVTDMTIVNDTLYCISSTSTTQTYLLTDSIFTVLHLANMTSAGFTQKGIVKTQSGVGVVSESRSNLSSTAYVDHTHATLNVFGKLNGNNFTEDIAVVSWIADSAYATVSAASSTVNPSVYTTHLRAKVKVKNKGTSPLTGFNLNYYTGAGIVCGAYWWQQNYTVTVPAGDTVEILTPFIQKTDFIAGPVQSTLTQTLCFFGTVPNGKADKYYQDNELCNSVNFPTDIGLREHAHSEIYAIIYPNPVSSVLKIQANMELTNVNMTDQLGRLVLHKDLKGVTMELDLSQLQNGIYFLKIETEKGTITKKVIKQ